MSRAKNIGCAKGKHFQRKESNSKLFIFVVLTMMITIMAFIRVEQTMAKYVVHKETSLSITTSNFHFLAETDETEFNTIGEITSNISTKNFENNEYTNTDIAYTTTATNNHYDITIQNGTATLTGGQNSTGIITIVATPKENVELNDTETIVVTITTLKPYVDTKTINLVVDTRFTVTYEYNDATDGNTETSKRVRYNRVYGTLPNPGREYTTGFNTNGGTSLENQTVAHTFDGWYKEALFNTLIGEETIVTDAFAHNIYAKWILSSIRVGETSKSGYTFDGWYLNNEFTGVRYDIGDTYTPVSNETMYAKWNLNTYTINYTLNGGTVQSANPTTYTVESNDITLNNPSKTGYTFLGWTGSNGNVESTLVTIPHGSIGNKEYTANWVINFSRLTIDPNGGRVDVIAYGEENPTTINSATTYQQNYDTTLTVGTPVKDDNIDTSTTYTITYNGNGGSVSIASNEATRTIVTEYTFNEWIRSNPCYGTLENGIYTYPSESNVQSTLTADYKSREKLNTVSSVVTANAERVYTVTYNHNYEGSVNKTETSNYTMNGWYTATTGGTKRANNNGTYIPSQSEVLYAQWISDSITYVPTRTGYIFEGWYTNDTCTNKATGVDGIYTPTSNITLYAKWTASTYTATYEYNGATGENSDLGKQVIFNSIYGELAEPERIYTVSYNTDGGSSITSQTATYQFAGWYKENIFENLVTRDTTVTTSSNHSLFAKWIAVSVRLENSTKTGHTLDGWYDNSSLTGTLHVVGEEYTPTENVTMYAKWKVNSYSVTYNYSTNGGTSSTKMSDTKNYNENIDLTPIATKSGWTFMGWNTDPNATVGLATLKMGAGDIILYAIYSKELVLCFNQASGTVTNKTAMIYNNNTSTTVQVAQIENYTGYTAVGWTTLHTPTTTGTIASGQTGVTVSISNTGTNYYAVYSKSIRATFIDYKSSTKTTNYSAYVDKLINTYNLSNETYPTITTRTLNTYSSSYTNTGWTSSTELNTTDVIEENTQIELTDNTTFYGIYRKTYTATFYDYLGSEAHTWYGYSHVQKSSYNIGATEVTIPLTMPEPSNYTGWTALGWSQGTNSSYTTSVPTYAIGATIEMTANNSYYARYSQDVTLTFIDYNGTTKQTRTVTGTRNAYAYSNRVANPTITSPTIATYNDGVSNWSAYGWTTNTAANASRNYTSGANISGVTEDATYYARYNKSVTAYFRFYGRTTSITYSKDDSGNVTSTTNSNTDGVITRSASGTRYVNSYDITNTIDPSVAIETCASQTTNSGSTTYPHTEVTTRMITYTTLVGWTTSTSSFETEIGNSGNITLLQTTYYYAIQQRTFNATFYSYNGTSQKTQTISTYPRINAYAVSNVRYDKITIPEAGTFTDWTYVGWINSTGYTQAATTPNHYTGDTLEVTAAVTYYAIYERPVRIIYNLNGGTGDIPDTVVYRRKNAYSTSASYVYTPPATITSLTPTRSGYTYKGWNTTATETSANTKYAAGKTYTIAYNKTEFELYAVWTMDTYTIGYTLDGGTVSSSNSTSYNVTTATFTLNNPTKTGYTFIGWTGTNGSIPQTTITIQKGSTGNRTYTANWSKDTYTISYTLNSGDISGTNPTIYYVDTASFTLINPIKSGYRFLGWTGTNGSTPQKTITISKGSTGNRTYTANWEQAVLSVGDFVNYDAGTWTQDEITAIKATGSRTNSTSSSYYWMFEGYAVGDSRNKDATPYSSSYATVASGWRVFDIDTTNNTVTLISAGNPENYLAGATSPSASKQTGYIGEYRMGHTTVTPTYSTFKNKNYSSRNWNEYVNTSQHAISATSLTVSRLQEWYNKYVNGVTSSTPITTAANMRKVYGTRYESIVDNHTFYWFATNVTSGRYLYRYVANSSQGSIASATGTNARGPFGVRILVTLSGANFTYANEDRSVTRVNTYSYGVWDIS